MCTSIVEVGRVLGMAKCGQSWVPLREVVIAYDHARHAPFGDVVTLDFLNTSLSVDARAAVELTLESARSLHELLGIAIAAASGEEKRA